MTIYTIGHSTRPIDPFLALLQRDGITRLVDIRRFPGSRRHPQFGSEQLAASLRERGVEYTHLPELGGRRRAERGAPATAWRNASFAGYAAYMRSPEFHAGMDRLVDLAARDRVVIMCSEALPWRCHRTLVSDALLARGVEVCHITDHKDAPHRLTPFAVIEGQQVSYPPDPSGSLELESRHDRA